MLTRSMTLAQTTESLRLGRTDLPTFLRDVCDRIDVVDPEVKAFLPEADRRARLLTVAGARADRSPFEDRSPLYGVPVGIKDIIHVEGFPTKAGSAVPPDRFGGPEATVVRRLKDAGAIVAGKTVSTEFAMSSPGPTRNPNDLDHTPGGSSSGSAAAVAAGMIPLAVGTQTGGSVIRPAAFCGIVGLKPSFGRIPTDGVVPLSESCDTVGLYTQDVVGMHIAAGVCCSDWSPVDPGDPPTIAITDGPYLEPASPKSLDSLESTVGDLESAGIDVSRGTAFDDIERVNEGHQALTSAEIAGTIGPIMATNESDFREETIDRVREGYDVTAEEIVAAREYRLTARRAVTDRMDDLGIDCWIAPSAPGPALDGIDDTGDPVMNKPWTYTGLPVVSLPAGTVDALPVGLQVIARFGDDERLLAWAERIESVID